MDVEASFDVIAVRDSIRRDESVIRLHAAAWGKLLPELRQQ
ncbi:DUF397 domain-containing protein [Streptomyces sp. SID3343]|nr:DUF397 domain-containing protein [Streptomyces sp. SID3343]